MAKFTNAFVVVLAVILWLGFSPAPTWAQSQTAPPLLMQQTAPAPIVAPPPQMVAGNVPPPATGIPVTQTIPAQTLLANINQAEQTALAACKLLAPGKVWIMRAPGGEAEVKAGLLYQNVAVAVLHFNPQNGTLLPLGVNPHIFQNAVDLKTIKNNLTGILKNLKILPAAEFMEPEACWSFPLAYNNRIIAHLKIYYDGVHVVQDFAANQEMTFYGH